MKKNKLNNYLQIIEENKNYKLSVRTNSNSSYHRYMEMAHKQSEFYILTESNKTGLTPLGEFFFATLLTASLGLGSIVGGAVAVDTIQDKVKINNEIQQQIKSSKINLNPEEKEEILELIKKKYEKNSNSSSKTLENIKKEFDEALTSEENLEKFKEKNKEIIEKIKSSKLSEKLKKITENFLKKNNQKN
jgi:hypothetical protein